MKNQTIKIRISDDTKSKFRKLCEMQGAGMSRIIQRMIDFEIEKNKSILNTKINAVH